MTKRLHHVQTLLTKDPDRWQDSATLVTADWVDKINAEARDGGYDRDVIRMHPDDLSLAGPRAITFPTSPATVCWMAGLPR